MADFYSDGLGRSRHREVKSRSRGEFWMFILDVIITVAMLLLLFASLTILICQYVSPAKSGVLSVIALGAPIIYLLDVAVMLYWIVRMKWFRASAMALIVVVGLFYLSRYYKLEIDRAYETKYSERKYTKVMTYNVYEGVKDGLFDYIATHNPDILCLQEINENSYNWMALEEMFGNTTINRSAISGNQILTKYRIVRKGEIEGLSTSAGIWADVRIKSDTVRVIGLHLKSTSIKPEDTKFLESHEYLLDSDRDSKLRSIAGRLSENNRKRAVQAKIVEEFIENSPYKVIVCGDFNDVPLSYTYQTIAKRLNDAFSEMAVGFAYTYNTRYKLLRIDNILVSPEIEVASYEVDNKVDLSDHYPVIARLTFQ